MAKPKAKKTPRPERGYAHFKVILGVVGSLVGAGATYTGCVERFARLEQGQKDASTRLERVEMRIDQIADRIGVTR